MLMSTEMPAIGQTNKTVFWSVLLVSLLALTGLVSLASGGSLALAAAIPVPFTVQSSSLTGTNFKMFPGVSAADNKSPVAVTQLDAQISNMVITKSFSFFGHTVTVKLNAGSQTPVSIKGLTLDASALNVNTAAFQNMSLNAGGSGGLEIDAPSATLTGSTINSPYLLANQITLTNLSLSISMS